MQSIALLEKLLSFPTISRDSNLALIEFIQSYLQSYGISSQLIHNDEQTKANLYAVIGPRNKSGVMLSGHTDVVPVSGQIWSHDPFTMREEDGLLYGRGSADMKGFIACALAMVAAIDTDRLITPLHLAFSYDEEVGCIGVRRLLDMLSHSAVKPKFCIVGEPTCMQPVVAHKGKTAGRVCCTGVECHSSLAPQGLNAIYLATDMITAFREIQEKIILQGCHDDEYDVTHTTVHVGVIEGGTALNIVPNHCEFKFEIRHLPEDQPEEFVAELRQRAATIVAGHQQEFPAANITVTIDNSYPALSTPTDSEVVQFVTELSGANRTGKVTFGTEGGLFSEQLNIPTIVMGPGNIQQAHKPDEYIALSEIQRCDDFLGRLANALYR
ncbi:acetylornithine deacetylase (ArgE) [Chromatiales bacterium (ex Bugula neritina AB1)]|nr:acetylornithine deacetylase (ArgE) [Chromatiales bacterium (ex Bugula neritina AB1)]